MEWLENTPPRARLALSVGGAGVAALANQLPQSLQLVALGAGIALCCYGIAASMRGPRKSTNWLEEERIRDFERQQHSLMYKFRNLRRGS
jgi:arginine exporter protein ArgO